MLQELLFLFLFSLAVSECVYPRSNVLNYYQRCNYDIDCQRNAFCVDNYSGKLGYCRCKPGFILQKNGTHYECLEPSNINQVCSADIQCHYRLGPISFCNEKHLCQCKFGAHLGNDGYCWSSRKLNRTCRTSQECILSDGTYAYCTDNLCTCPVNYHPATDFLHCVQSADIGDVCTSNDNCNYTFAECYNNVCKCLPDYVKTNKRSCLKVAKTFGDSCLKDNQCNKHLRGSICNNGYCDCPSGYHAYLGSCHHGARPKGSCAKKSDCVFSKSWEDLVDCIGGKCTCSIGTDAKRQMCVLAYGSNWAAQVKSRGILISFFLGACILVNIKVL